MDKMNPTLQPNLVSSLNQYYAAQQPDAAFSSRLENQLRHHQIELMSPTQKSNSLNFNARRTFMQTIRTRPMLVILLSILALMALTGVVYALGRLTGFIPGFGFTTDAQSVYLLSEPVEVISGDMTLRVDQAVSDESKFWVNLTAVGLPEEQDTTQAFIYLSNGKKIPFQMGSGVNVDSGNAHFTYVFPPLPTATGDLILAVENLGGQTFSFPLQLSLAKPD